MKFFDFLKQWGKRITPLGANKQFTKQDALVYGTIVIIILAAALMVWDAQIFYSTVIKKNRLLSHPETQSLIISQEDVDEIIQLLDLRQQKFQEILEER